MFNLPVLYIGWTLAAMQAFFSWEDGFLTQKQMRSRCIFNGWSFMEHGGMWIDVFILTPAAAFIWEKYRLEGVSWRLFVSGILIIAIISSFGTYFRKANVGIPEAHNHDGKTTLAGYLHGIYAVGASGSFAAFFFLKMSPEVTPRDRILIALALTPFGFCGAAKWNRRWFRNFPHDRPALISTIAVPIAVWTIVLIEN